MARKFGGATILGVAVGCSALLTVFTPMAARAHVGVLIALRIVIGLAEVRTHAHIMTTAIIATVTIKFQLLLFL